MVDARIEKCERDDCTKCALSSSQLSDTNLHFIERRCADGNLNEAIDLARIAWEQFPKSRESADVKQLLDALMDGLQEKMNSQILGPITSTTNAMTTIIDRLQDLTRTNPALIEQGFAKTLESFRLELNGVKAVINEPSTRIAELSQLVNQLVYKPTAKGNAGEAILTELWVECFIKDQIDMLGGAGREDLLIRPYLGSNGFARFGDAISVERKTGKQKITGSHREEAIRHAKQKGASIALLVYDTPENLPNAVKPMSVSRDQGILVIVAELQSGTWILAREMVDIIEHAMLSSNKGVQEIDMGILQEVVTELGSLVKLLEQVKGNGVKIKVYAEEIERNAITMQTLVKSFQGRMQAAVEGTSNQIPLHSVTANGTLDG
jgi:hypothetical protein